VPVESTVGDTGSDMLYGPRIPSAPGLLKLLHSTCEQLTAAEQKLIICKFDLERFSTDSRKLQFYTGFKNYHLLTQFFEWLQPTAQLMAYPYFKKTNIVVRGRQRVLVLIDEFFLVMCRLHAGLLVEDLADRFQISVSTCSRIFLAWINLLYVVLGSVNIWPSSECVSKFRPVLMKDKFPSVRVIVDCTEIFVQKPSSLVANTQFFSSYKSHATFKGLLGIAPHGAVVFVSSLYSGSISDVELTKSSGLLDLLEAGDSVMADKGFTIGKLLAERNCRLVIPHFLSCLAQFSASEVADNDAITACRVHVERAIRRIKESRILQGILPLTLIGSANQILTVCCLMSNFRSDLF